MLDTQWPIIHFQIVQSKLCRNYLTEEDIVIKKIILVLKLYPEKHFVICKIFFAGEGWFINYITQLGGGGWAMAYG